jgi:hypothetical protein
MLRNSGTWWHTSFALGVVTLGQGGCGDGGNGSGPLDGGVATDGSGHDATPDVDVAAPPDADVSGNADGAADANVCAQRSASFTDFVAAHSACTSNTDCTVIGDCGPNADFRAIRVDASAQGLELMKARCHGPYDGPLFDAVCINFACGLQRRTGACCGCPPNDAGPDGADGGRETK